jgi:hypothetical protein
MSCRISELVIPAQDPEALARFWCQVLGYVVFDRTDDGAVEISPPHAGFGSLQPTLVFELTKEPKTAQLRMHFDVSPTGGDQEAELSRLLAAGATLADVGQTGDETWRVLADPEGNEFCLLGLRLDPAEEPARRG